MIQTAAHIYKKVHLAIARLSFGSLTYVCGLAVGRAGAGQASDRDTRASGRAGVWRARAERDGVCG